MADKKTFILRINTDTYRQLEKWAADEFRSVNGQLEWIIDQALREAGRKKPAAVGERKAKKS
ncbi:MAG TPA: hypothetical protein PKE63_05380 [Lacibacter sp.]|nr:hypothetical protein [Lacibacter sp.]HMO88842.1 hypothetical protein [Lacibacter sp.]HMP86687.1 hypothetical protein [Lacibacter sp.]